MSRTFLNGLALVMLSVLSLSADAAETQIWQFDLFTEGGDVDWVSPTATSPNAPLYEVRTDIQFVEIEVRYVGIRFGPFDVTDQIPPEFTHTQVQVDGPAPVVLAANSIVFPPPPDPATLSGDLRIELDAGGVGHFALRNLTFGTIVLDLGFPFGTVTADLASVRVRGITRVTPILPGDLDGDDEVGLSDLAILLSNFGTPSGALPEDGDITGDGAVTLEDLALLLANFGKSL